MCVISASSLRSCRRCDTSPAPRGVVPSGALTELRLLNFEGSSGICWPVQVLSMCCDYSVSGFLSQKKQLTLNNIDHFYNKV